MDGSADGAEIQFSLQSQLSALDVGLMERVLYFCLPLGLRLVPAHLNPSLFIGFCWSECGVVEVRAPLMAAMIDTGDPRLCI